MHPMLGNTLNQRVRESAEAALAEIFRVTSHTQQRPPPATAPNSDLRSRIQVRTLKFRMSSYDS